MFTNTLRRECYLETGAVRYAKKREIDEYPTFASKSVFELNVLSVRFLGSGQKKQVSRARTTRNWQCPCVHFHA